MVKVENTRGHQNRSKTDPVEVRGKLPLVGKEADDEREIDNSRKGKRTLVGFC